MAVPVRLSISTCVGCGSMREFATCDGMCRERKLELVSGGEYDELVVEAAACRARIGSFLPIVEELAAGGSWRDDWRERYESLRERVRLVLRATGPRVCEAQGSAPPSSGGVVVWRCPDCGGLEAPQPCIGVCIWRPLDWVQAGAFEIERAQALLDVEVERSLAGLLTRLARVTPREGEWERNWRAFEGDARELLRQSAV